MPRTTLSTRWRCSKSSSTKNPSRPSSVRVSSPMPHRERPRRPARPRRPRAPRPGPGRTGRAASSGWSSSHSWARTTAIGRPTSPAMCSLPRSANVSTVHSVVSMARRAGRQRRLGRRRRGRRGPCTSAPSRPVANQPSGSCPPVRSNSGPASGGPVRPGAISHTTPAADRVVEQLADRAARPRRTPRATRRGGRAAGSRRPGSPCPTGRPGRRAASSGVGAAAGVDEAEHPPGRPGQAGPQPQRAGRRVELVADRDGRRSPTAGRSSVRPNASSRRALVSRTVPAASGSGGPTGAGGTSVPSAAVVRGRARRSACRVEAEELLAQPVEGGGQQVEVLDRRRPAALSAVLDVVGHLARTAGGSARARPRRRGSPRTADASVRRGAGGEQRAADGVVVVTGAGRRHRRRRARGRRCRASSPPSVCGRASQLGLPLQPQRHPRLRPRRHPDRATVRRRRRSSAAAAGRRCRPLDDRGVVGGQGAGRRRRRRRRRRSAGPASASRRRADRAGRARPCAAPRTPGQPRAGCTGSGRTASCATAEHLGRDRAVAERRQHVVARRARPFISRTVWWGHRHHSRPSGEARPSPPWRRLRPRPAPRRAGRAGSGTGAPVARRRAVRCSIGRIGRAALRAHDARRPALGR